MQTVSPHALLARLEDFTGRRVALDGQLIFAFEDVCVSQWPRTEAGDRRESSLWLSPPPEPSVFAFDEATLTRWHGRRVVVVGRIDDRGGLGCGHFGGWRAEIVAERVEPHALWVENHGPTDPTGGPERPVRRAKPL